MDSISLFSRTRARMFPKSLTFAMRMTLVGLFATGFIDPAHAQTVPEEKQEAAGKERQEGAAGDVTTLPEMKISAERLVSFHNPTPADKSRAADGSACSAIWTS